MTPVFNFGLKLRIGKHNFSFHIATFSLEAWFEKKLEDESRLENGNFLLMLEGYVETTNRCYRVYFHPLSWQWSFSKQITSEVAACCFGPFSISIAEAVWR